MNLRIDGKDIEGIPKLLALVLWKEISGADLAALHGARWFVRWCRIRGDS